LNINLELCPEFDSYPPRANTTALNVRLKTLICPSDGIAATCDGYPTSYRGNVGVGPSADATAETPDSGNGFFPFLHRNNASMITDGLSNTVAFSERLVGSGGVGPTIPSRDFGNILINVRGASLTADFALDVCRLAAASPEFPLLSRGGYLWHNASLGDTYYTHAQEPNGPIPDATAFPYENGVATARSFHPGGVNALMADGSTRFVSESIQRKIWRALGTRNGGELVE